MAGVHVKGGMLNIAVVEQKDCGTIRLVSTTRQMPNSALSESARLADLADRYRQHLSPLDVNAVGILQTRSFSKWKYSDAFNRVFGICAVLQGSAALSIAATTFTTNAVGSSVSLDADKLKNFAPEAVGERDTPVYWTTGMAEACAVAVHATKASQ